MRDPILLSPALWFYALYIISLMIFAVSPAVDKNSRIIAAKYGALLWFTAYMTYDLTNRSTLKSRPVDMVLPDILRGTFVSSVVAVIWYFVWIKLTHI